MLLWCKIAKKGECSALLWSFNELQIVYGFVRVLFVVWYKKYKNDSDKFVHNLQLNSAWIGSFSFEAIFSVSIYTATGSVHTEYFSCTSSKLQPALYMKLGVVRVGNFTYRADGSVCEVSYPYNSLNSV